MRTADAQLGPFQPQVSAVGQHALFTEAEYFFFSSGSEVKQNDFWEHNERRGKNKKARLEYRPLEMEGADALGDAAFSVFQITGFLQTMVCVCWVCLC